MESGTQVQLQTDGPEIIIASVGSTGTPNIAKQATTANPKVIRTNIPRVVIVAAPSQLSGCSGGATTATDRTKQQHHLYGGGSGHHHAGGQTLQQPVPPRPIIIHPPNIAKLAVVSASSSNQGQTSSASVSSGDNGQGRQLMIIQQPSSVSNAQSTHNQSIIVSVAGSDGRSDTQAVYPIQQYVASNDVAGDMLYSSPTVGNHDVHHLQSTATYVYGVQEDGSAAYNNQVSYYQSNNAIGYQQQQQSPSSAAYLVQNQDDLNGSDVEINDDDTPAQLGHSTRASPATIQWLLQNYETADAVSLPRCTLYNHYLKHCTENKLDPVNAASFGKLIRSVFLGLKTRRLGTRGNSKYHYYGIRIKPESPLNKMTEDSLTLALRQQPTVTTKRPATRSTFNGGSTTSQTQQGSQPATNQPVHQQQSSINGTGPTAISSGVITSSSPNDEHKSLLGDGVVPNVVPPPLEPLEPHFQRIGLSLLQAEKFFVGYRQHCEDLLDCVKNLLFNDIETCWRQFWQADENSPLDDEFDDESSDLNLTGLTRSQLHAVCSLQPVVDFIQAMDFQFYQVVVDVLVPNVLKPIPNNLTQSIRNFAKHLENGLAVALQGAPDIIIKLKLDAVSSLAQTLRRYTSLNHLAQAARAVLQNPAQITQMLADLNRVDFRNVQEQASWVCYCNPAHVEEIEKSFKASLEKQNTLEQWAEWLGTVVDQVLAEFSSRRLNDLIGAAKDFLLKWSFYSSMVMRDLTLRSAPSFGSFHLIRLLYDEYMFYLVEQKVARANGQTTIAVMSQSHRHNMLPNNTVLYDNTQSYNGQNNHVLDQSRIQYDGHDHFQHQLVDGTPVIVTDPTAVSSDSNQIIVDQIGNSSVVTSDDVYLNGHTDDPGEYFLPDDKALQKNPPPLETPENECQLPTDEVLHVQKNISASDNPIPGTPPPTASPSSCDNSKRDLQESSPPEDVKQNLGINTKKIKLS